jgi:hypothetical protein
MAKAKAKRRERIRRQSTTEKNQAINHKIRVENAILDGCAAEGPTRVRVLELGGYFAHKRYYEGNVLTIPGPEAYSERWMAVVTNEVPESLTTSHERLRQEHQEIQANKRAEATGGAREADAEVLTADAAAAAIVGS